MPELATYRVMMDDGDWSEVRALSHEDAATTAMECWYKGGAFAGDPLPSALDLVVTGSDGVGRVLSIDVDWSPDFHATDTTEREGAHCPVPGR